MNTMSTAMQDQSPYELVGANRTGIAMSPLDTARLLTPTSSPLPPPGDATTLAKARAGFLAIAPPLGTLAPPTSLKGAATTAVNKLRGRDTSQFLDKLSERIAFERTGVRLYDLFLAKAGHSKAQAFNLPLTELMTIRNEELAHFEMLVRVANDLGADATMMSPSADIVGILAQGLVQVLADPRIDAMQSMQAILIAELADNDSWQELTILAEKQGLSEVAAEFSRAEEDEQRHLAVIRRLMQASKDDLM